MTEPTKEEIATLPRLAQLALAARSAKRVQPLVKHFWPGAPREYLDAIDAANTLVQTLAARPAGVSDAEVRPAARAVRAAVDAASGITSDTGRAVYASAASASAAACAAATSAFAFDADVHTAVTGASMAAFFADATVADVADAAVRRDFELLKNAAEHDHWTDDTPVPPEFFGPLWPDGAPEGWPAEVVAGQTEPRVLKIEFAVPPGMSDAESREFNEKVKDFLVALSALDASMGGTGLRILEDVSTDPIECESEEPIWSDADPVGVGS